MQTTPFFHVEVFLFLPWSVREEPLRGNWRGSSDASDLSAQELFLCTLKRREGYHLEYRFKTFISHSNDLHSLHWEYSYNYLMDEAELWLYNHTLRTK